MPGRAGARSWAVVALLLAFQVVDFGEKSVLGPVAVSLSAEFGLGHTAYGFVSSSFFFLYSLAGLVVGFVATRVPPPSPPQPARTRSPAGPTGPSPERFAGFGALAASPAGGPTGPGRS